MVSGRGLRRQREAAVNREIEERQELRTQQMIEQQVAGMAVQRLVVSEGPAARLIQRVDGNAPRQDPSPLQSAVKHEDDV
jgi:hypothetical protein